MNLDKSNPETEACQDKKLRPLHESLAVWLSQPKWAWTWYVTQTFKCENPTPRLGEVSFRHWMSQLSRASAACWGFVFGEVGKLGRFHWHALIHISPNLWGLPETSIFHAWALEKYGRNTVAWYRGPDDKQLMHAGEKLSRYLTKYIAKDTENDNLYWDWLGFVSGAEVLPGQIGQTWDWELDGILAESGGITPEREGHRNG